MKQALGDVAYFIQNLKSQFIELNNSKVVLVGGSYSGSMVVWFNNKYPGLIDVGWASSAPIFAKLDNTGNIIIVQFKVTLHLFV